MSIQVEMPEMWIARNECESWGFFIDKPHFNEDVGRFAEWFDKFGNEGIPIKVTGYTGTWQDSLHQYVNGQWRKA